MSLSVVVDIGLEKRFLNAGQYLVKLIYQQEQKHPYHMINKTFKGRVHFTGNQNDKMMLAGKPKPISGENQHCIIVKHIRCAPTSF